ncbi:MAG TPA: sulfurtransferase-like selenium metabolism protein YedF [Syntrophales bacterium]|nr:sulfurtransferase-like selenium metabolism protein YedF [Syntrophales bacterium]
MSKVIDAKGLACPEPVILTKKALEQKEDVTVIVDDEIAAGNIKRLGAKLGLAVSIEKKEGGISHIHISGAAEAEKQPVVEKDTDALPYESYNAASLVVAISSDRMGRGNDELGYVLIRSFVHTLLTLNPLPDTIIFYNTGVKLAGRDSEVIDDLKQLEEAGTSILVCGTCTNYFGISDALGAGCISNMYDIANTMAGAGRLITP